MNWMQIVWCFMCCRAHMAAHCIRLGLYYESIISSIRLFQSISKLAMERSWLARVLRFFTFVAVFSVLHSLSKCIQWNWVIISAFVYQNLFKIWTLRNMKMFRVSIGWAKHTHSIDWCLFFVFYGWKKKHRHGQINCHSAYCRVCVHIFVAKRLN